MIHSLLYCQLHCIIGTHRVQQSTEALQPPADVLQIFQGGRADKTVDGPAILRSSLSAARREATSPITVSLCTRWSHKLVRVIRHPSRRSVFLAWSWYSCRSGMRRCFVCHEIHSPAYATTAEPVDRSAIAHACYLVKRGIQSCPYDLFVGHGQIIWARDFPNNHEIFPA
jgi:hypothetical protein